MANDDAPRDCPETSRTNPVKAIRLKCLDCSGGSGKEVEKCGIKNCALHPFRFGRNPFRTKRELSDEQKQAAVERLEKARMARLVAPDIENKGE